MHTQFSIHSEPDTQFHSEAWQFPSFIVLRVEIGDATVEAYFKNETQMAEMIKAISESQIIVKQIASTNA